MIVGLNIRFSLTLTLSCRKEKSSGQSTRSKKCLLTNYDYCQHYFMARHNITSRCSASSFGCKHDTARICCWAPCSDASDWAVSKPIFCCCNWTERQTDRRTRTLYRYIYPAAHLLRGSVNRLRKIAVAHRWWSSQCRDTGMRCQVRRVWVDRRLNSERWRSSYRLNTGRRNCSAHHRPISTPTLHPWIEANKLNGFTWTLSNMMQM